LLFASSRNKRNALAASASLKMEKLIEIHRGFLVNISYPALSLKINL
jgi:hypothetical protein